ncbi:hypothetical protein CTI12_AA208120 [Artemisia annua]|uniref:Uncharacterized protein n=1 Tax=Artemisia annua TaxID=35608 RepID=A0A2U1KDJ0_ARTAN|nr:hypothetical protein CTI12_AA615230 [Artemisia annua]PWA79144.1 hypothetical protein CTI12_AA208120 [Artemisia annua]
MSWYVASVNYNGQAQPNYLYTLDERYEQIKGSSQYKAWFDAGRVTYDDRLKMFQINHNIDGWREWAILTYNQMRIQATVLTGTLQHGVPIQPGSQQQQQQAQVDALQNQQLQSMREMLQNLQVEIQGLRQQVSQGANRPPPNPVPFPQPIPGNQVPTYPFGGSSGTGA